MFTINRTVPCTALLMSLLCSLLLGTVTTSAQTNDQIVKDDCESAPFTTAKERAKVKKEDPDCYELRAAFGEYAPDSQVLEHVSPTFDNIQTGLQFLQQLQSLSTQNSGGSQSAPSSPSFVDSYLESGNEVSSDGDLYSTGLAPSLYFQPSEAIPSTSTVTFGQGANARTYRIEGDRYIDQETNEVFSWAELSAEADRVLQETSASLTTPDPTPTTSTFTNPSTTAVAHTDTSTSPQTNPSVLHQLLSRPDPSANQSNPLSPNLLSGFSSQLTGAVQLFNRTTVPTEPGDTTPTPSGFMLLAGGIFAPVQNLIVGVANSVTSLLNPAR